jgi:hypothetical protein
MLKLVFQAKKFLLTSHLSSLKGGQHLWSPPGFVLSPSEMRSPRVLYKRNNFLLLKIPVFLLGDLLGLSVSKTCSSTAVPEAPTSIEFKSFNSVLEGSTSISETGLVSPITASEPN